MPTPSRWNALRAGRRQRDALLCATLVFVGPLLIGLLGPFVEPGSHTPATARLDPRPPVAFLITNGVVLLWLLAGAVTLGATTITVLSLNGFLLGLTLQQGAASGLGPLELLALTLPHAIVEAAGFIAGATAALAVTRHAVLVAAGLEPRQERRTVGRDAVVLTVGSFGCLLLASVAEATVTPAIGRLLLG